MSVSVTCPGCGKRYKVPDSKIGSAIACKQCETQIFVSAAGDESKRLRSRRGAAELSDGDLQKRKIGVSLMILGVGSLLLPIMGLQFRLLVLLGDSAPLVGTGLAYLGAAMYIVAMRSQPVTAAIVGGGVAAATTFLAAPLLQQLNGAPGGPHQHGPPHVQNDKAVPPGGPPAPAPVPSQHASSHTPQVAHQFDTSSPAETTGPSRRPGRPPGFGPGNRPPFGRPGGTGNTGRSPQGGMSGRPPAGRRSQQTAANRSRPTQLDLSHSTDSAPINLLGVIQPGRDQLSGLWMLQNGVLTSPMRQPARLDIPVTPPESYVLTLDVRRLQGNDSLNIGLVIGGRGITAVLDGYGGQTSGLNRLDGQTADVNASTFRGKSLPNGRISNIVCRVGPKSVQVTCNGRSVITWSGDPQRLSRDPRWIPGRDDHLQIGSWATKWQITRVELTPIQ